MLARERAQIAKLYQEHTHIPGLHCGCLLCLPPSSTCVIFHFTPACFALTIPVQLQPYFPDVVHDAAIGGVLSMKGVLACVILDP
jgi:hypothetical protein